MAFIKKSLFLLVFLKCIYGDNDCTLSDVIINQFKNGYFEVESDQSFIETDLSDPKKLRFYTVTKLTDYDDCLGFTTENFYTIIFSCPNGTTEKPGCFQVLTPKLNSEKDTGLFTKQESVCVSKLDDLCVELKIHNKTSITLACYLLPDDTTKEHPIPDSKACTFADVILSQFKKGYLFRVNPNEQFTGMDLSNPEKITYYNATQLTDYNDCIGLTTETFVIILRCPKRTTEKRGCFQVLTKHHSDESAGTFTEKESVCVTKLNDTCVGLTIHNKTSITLSCELLPPDVVVGGVTGHIPDNGPPSV